MQAGAGFNEHRVSHKKEQPAAEPAHNEHWNVTTKGKVSHG